MDSHWAVTTSSGRRVSLLCDEEISFSGSYASTPGATPTPPPSPGYYNRPYAPIRADSISSACSSSSSLSTASSHGYYSPRTPPDVSMSLPSFEKLLPTDNFFSGRRFTPEIHSPVIAPALLADASNTTPTTTTTTTTTTAAAPSPPTTTTTPPAPPATPPAPPKRPSRRYTCHCAKSFTTSGHLARHMRIHTGEKNYVCPEPSCGARFSRQDNCMQHFRTHAAGAGGKRPSRRARRSSADVVVPAAPAPARRFADDAGGLAALATVACEASV